MTNDFERLFGELPFGFKRSDDGMIVENEAEQRVLRCVQNALDSGLSPREIAKLLLKGCKDGTQA